MGFILGYSHPPSQIVPTQKSDTSSQHPKPGSRRRFPPLKEPLAVLDLAASKSRLCCVWKGGGGPKTEVMEGNDWKGERARGIPRCPTQALPTGHWIGMNCRIAHLPHGVLTHHHRQA